MSDHTISESEKNKLIAHCMSNPVLARVLSMPESASPSGALAVAGGWVPASSAESLLGQWVAESNHSKNRAKIVRAEQNNNWAYVAAIRDQQAETLDACIEDLRRLIAAANVRQPAPNT